MDILDIIAVLGLIAGTCLGYVALCAEGPNHHD